MRKLLKHVAALFLIPMIRWHLRKERRYRFEDIEVTVMPGVFHPGFFSSTKFLLSFLKRQSLKGCSLLELGCGTALISIYAARLGVQVTASDLNLKAINNARRNAELNRISIDIIHSDLFQNIPLQTFDWIIINPPYYAQTPQTDADLAWYCGANFEYFRNLFSTIGKFIRPESHVIMVLTRGCDISKISAIALSNKFELVMIEEKNVLFDEKDFLYRIKLLGETP